MLLIPELFIFLCYLSFMFDRYMHVNLMIWLDLVQKACAFTMRAVDIVSVDIHWVQLTSMDWQWLLGFSSLKVNLPAIHACGPWGPWLLASLTEAILNQRAVYWCKQAWIMSLHDPLVRQKMPNFFCPVKPKLWNQYTIHPTLFN